MRVNALKGTVFLMMLGLVCCLLVIMAGQSQADTTYVKQGAAGGGTSWADATGDLRGAVDSATIGDIIWVAAGTYTPVLAGQPGTRTDTFQLTNDIELYGGFPNTGSPTWGQRHIFNNKTALSGEILNPGTTADNCYHVLYSTGSSVTAIIDGFIITGGNASPIGIKPIFALAAMEKNTTSPSSNRELRVLPHSQAAHPPSWQQSDGGGMFNTDGAAPTVQNCFFVSNSALEAGGGVCNLESSPTFYQCDFAFNIARNDGGGGMANFYSSAPLVEYTFFVGNEGDIGGGIYNYDNSSPTVLGSHFYGNAAYSYGGGMECESYSSPTVTNCYFLGNEGSNEGGGLEAYDSSHPTIDNCVFAHNRALDGGGISVYTNSEPLITNSTLHNNVADDEGGGIYNHYSAPTVTNCTVYGNDAGPNTGGGMYVDSGDPTVTNCIFWGNTSGTPASVIDEIFIGSGSPTFTYCDIQVNPGSPVYPGIGNISQNPLFVNTGSENFHLLPTSPCIDSGSNVAIQATGVTKDFDGDPRIINGTVDIGADEYVVGVQQYLLNTASTNGGNVNNPGEGQFGPFSNGAQVTLVAASNPGWHFINWTGDVATIADAGDPTTTITMNGNYSIVANFEINTYVLDPSSTAGGMVTAPGEAGPYTYDHGMIVNLIAVANSGWHFVNWTGNTGTITDASDPTTNITMNGNYAVTANFEEIPQVGLAVRTLPAVVAPGTQFDVNLSVAGCGIAGQVVETLPTGFTYISVSNPADIVVNVIGQDVRFTFIGDSADFSYTVTAPVAQGISNFYGIATDDNMVNYLVGGASTINVSTWSPWIYDTDFDTSISKPEALIAVVDFFDGLITKQQALEVIVLFFS